MSNLTVAALPSELYLNNDDRFTAPPDPPVEQVKDILTTAYSELATAKKVLIILGDESRLPECQT